MYVLPSVSSHTDPTSSSGSQLWTHPTAEANRRVSQGQDYSLVWLTTLLKKTTEPGLKDSS